jgi:hypothetical protein
MPRRSGGREAQPYPLSGACPCGSELSYGQCCKRKNFEFTLDKRGNVLRSIKIHPRLKPMLEDASRRFMKVFGRKPGRGDPVFFQQHLASEEDYWQNVRTAGKSAGTRDELIFAWRRSGFIVGKHSRKIMPDNEYQEWKDAIDEYFILKEEGVDPFHVFTYLSGEDYEKYKALVDRLDDGIIAVGSALSEPKKIRDSANYFRYLLMGRAIRSLRTIREMYRTRYDDDCLAIIRTVYEAYLRMKLLRLAPKSSERFEAMIAHELGAYQTKLRKNGRPSYDTCVDPKTGKEYKIIISNREILDISDFTLDEPLYYDLYPLLSGFVHPEFVQEAIKSVTGHDASQSSASDSIRAIIIVTTICILLLSEIAECIFLRDRTKRDVLYVMKQ